MLLNRYTIFLIFLLKFDLIRGKYLINDLRYDERYCSNKQLCNKKTFINKPNNFDRFEEESPSKSALCEACDLAIPSVLRLIAENKTEHVIPFVNFICNEFKIESPMVCELVIKEYAVS